MGCEQISVNVSAGPTIEVSSSTCGASSIDTSNFLTTGNAATLYYPRDNNISGYITSTSASGVTSLNTLAGTIFLTGQNGILVYTSGQYIQISGSSSSSIIGNYVSGISVTGFRPYTGLINVTGIGNITIFTGLNNNIIISGDINTISGYINSFYVDRINNQSITGNKTFVGDIFLNNLYPLVGYSGGILLGNQQIYSYNNLLALDYNTRRLYDSGGQFSLHWDDRKLFTTGNLEIANWESGKLYDLDGSNSIDWTGHSLYDRNNIRRIRWDIAQAYDYRNQFSIDWDGKVLFNREWPIVNWDSHYLIPLSGEVSLDWGNRRLFDTGSNVSLLWHDRILSGNWTLLGTIDKLQSTGSNLYTYITNTSGNFDTRLYNSGQTLLGLINAASAGVSSINGASGIISITGGGNVTVISGGIGLIRISGDTGAYSSFYPISNPNNYCTSGNIQNTGSNLYTYIINTSGNLDTRLYNSGQNLLGLIGVAITGVSSINGSSGIVNITGGGNITVISGGIGSIIISGDTGAYNNFYSLSNPLGFSTSGNLQNSGNNLQNTCNILSGNLIQSGINIEIQINSLSGYSNNTFYLLNNEQRLRSLIPTGTITTGIFFTNAFVSTPVIFNNFEISGNYSYNIAISGIGTHGFTGFFSDIIRESGVYLHTLAKIL